MSMRCISSRMPDGFICSFQELDIKHIDRYVGIIVVVIIRAAMACGEVFFLNLNQSVIAMKSDRKTTVSGGQKPW